MRHASTRSQSFCPKPERALGLTIKVYIGRLLKYLFIDRIYKRKEYIKINDWIYWKGCVIIQSQDIIVNGFTTIFPSRKSFESACSKDFYFCNTSEQSVQIYFQ